MKHTDELMDWYLQRSQKEAKAEANLLQALRDVAQLLAWQNNGESQGYSHRLLTPDHALRNVQTAIAQTTTMHDSLMAIAAHHEEQRELWAEDWNGDDDHADYHRERRDFALSAIGMPLPDEEVAI